MEKPKIKVDLEIVVSEDPRDRDYQQLKINNRLVGIVDFTTEIEPIKMVLEHLGYEVET